MQAAARCRLIAELSNLFREDEATIRSDQLTYAQAEERIKPRLQSPYASGRWDTHSSDNVQ